MKKKIAVIIAILMFLPLSIADPPLPAVVHGFIRESSGDSVPDGVTVVVKNLDTGGYYNTITTNGTGEYVTYVPSSMGNTIRVSCDYEGESGSCTTIIVQDKLVHFCNISLIPPAPPKEPPVADFSWNPYNPMEGETVSFSDQSSDPDGEIVSWDWRFGDGGTSSERNPSHIFTPGTYNVRLTVTDNDGLSDDISRNIEIKSQEPEPPPPDNGNGDEEEPPPDVWVPPPKPPKYPPEPPPDAPPVPPPFAYEVGWLYKVLKTDNLFSNNKIKIAVIDTGVTMRTYNGTDLTKIRVYHHPIYINGLDDNGHGTFTNFQVAFAIQRFCSNSIQYSIKALDKDGRAPVFIILECFDIAMDLDVDIISLSAGARGQVGDLLDMKARECKRHGIIVVSAAGNEGYGGVLSPALSESCIAVGTTDPMHTLSPMDDEVCSWSSKGPVEGVTEVKPDVVAPDESVLGPYLNEERVMTGTSMSTPMVASGILVMMAENKRILNILDLLYFYNPSVRVSLIEESIENTAHKSNSPDYTFGFGVPNFERASSKLHSLCVFYIAIEMIVVIGAVIIITVSIYLYKSKKTAEITF